MQKTKKKEKNSKIKNWFFMEIQKFDKPVAKLIMKKKKILITNIKKEK